MMDETKIEDTMYQKAIELINQRYPLGWGGSAIVYTSKHNFFTSIALETANGGAQLCIEVGAMCEAHKNNEKITHCLCVVRENETSPFQVLTPCGICQERLRYWGPDVLVGVTTEDKHLYFVKLSELQPHHWSKAYNQEDLEHFIE